VTSFYFRTKLQLEYENDQQLRNRSHKSSFTTILHDAYTWKNFFTNCV